MHQRQIREKYCIVWVKSKHSQSNILQKVLKIDKFGRIYVEDLKSDQIFCSRHVVPTISLYTDRNPLNIHHQLGHNKFDALRNMAIIKIKLIVSSCQICFCFNLLRFLVQQNTTLFSTFLRPPFVRHRRDISTFLVNLMV